MNRSILQPVLFASGVTLFLYTHTQELTPAAYLAPLPFWVLIGRPLGLLWNQKVLKEINREVFPPEMKNYREMYLVSKRAIAYDLMFNHAFYNPLLTLIIVGYSYSVRKAEEAVMGEKVAGEGGKGRSLLGVLQETGVTLLQMRAMVSLTSVLS